jgi:hypothetical protein
VSRQRRRAERAPQMTDHRGLDDDTTFGGEQTIAAECGAASSGRRAAAARVHPSFRSSNLVRHPLVTWRAEHG